MRRNKCARYAILILAVLWALAMSGCDQKTINQIKAEPERYASHEVAVVGKVTKSVSALGTGVYEIDDGTGRLWVVSKSGVPRKDARIVVRGTIRDAFNLSSIAPLPEPISSGLVMIERSHKAKD